MIQYVHNTLDKFPKSYNQWFIASVGAISGLMFGFDVSTMSVFVSNDAYREFFHYPGPTVQGAITAAVSGGCFIGAITCGVYSERIGRRCSLIVSAVLWILGAIIQCTCRDTAQLVVGRVVSGSAIGIGSVVTPSYISEISNRKIRGMIGGIYQASITLGILVMYFICYGLSFIKGTNSFRSAWAVQMFPALFMLVGILYLPESPRWLAQNDKWAEAERILKRVNSSLPEDALLIEIEEIKESVVLYKLAKETTYVDLFRKNNIQSTTVAISAQIWNQLTGMNVMMYYIVYVFEMVGFSGNAVLVSSSIQYVVNFVVTIISLPLPDLVGRRPLMVYGGVAMMVCLMIVGGLFAKYSEPIANVAANATVVITIPDKHKAAGRAICAFCYLFVACFASTWAVSSWTFFAEVLPNRTRIKAGGLAVASDWAFNFALALFVPPAFRNITWKSYFIFASFCGAMSIHAFLQYPETKGRTLEEIDMMFQKNIPAWRSHEFEVEIGEIERFGDEKGSVVHSEG